MVSTYRTPGVYVQEISTLPGTVAEVKSAIPAFIGYTEKINYEGRMLQGIPEHITSLNDFEARFGKGAPLCLEKIKIDTTATGRFSQVESISFTKRFLLYEAIYMYFSNGGGECYVVALDSFSNEDVEQKAEDFINAIDSLNMVEDITLVVMPEAVLLKSDLSKVQQKALGHCATCMNRFAILDIREEVSKEGKKDNILLNWKNDHKPDSWVCSYKEFRDSIGLGNLSYGAAYTPYIIGDTSTDFGYKDIKDHLNNSKTDEKLLLTDLDPVAQDAVKYLDNAIKDYTSFTEAIIKAAKKPVTVGNGGQPGERFVERPFLYEGFQDASGTDQKTIKDARDRLDTLLKLLTDLGEGYLLSDDLVRHLKDRLLQLIPKIKALPDSKVADSDESDALKKFSAVLDKLEKENVTDFIKLIENSLLDDIYYTIIKNIKRLSDGLLGTSAVYRSIHTALREALRVQPPSAAMAGLYAATDNSRGVWKAPANISISNCLGLTQSITAKMQEELNIDSVAGKSINALRNFPGKGFLVWGARTLDGNSQEWRYIPVRRFFLMVEESVRRATASSVFEPNDANLWSKVKAIIDNYLLQKWKDGALMGASAEEAYFVNIGLGATMTEQDILDGKLIVDIGMAVVRPAEFVVLRFMHKMQQ